jgi:hypothetical protein
MKYYIFFLILRTPKCLRVPPGVRVPQVEYHCFKAWSFLRVAEGC